MVRPRGVAKLRAGKFCQMTSLLYAVSGSERRRWVREGVTVARLIMERFLLASGRMPHPVGVVSMRGGERGAPLLRCCTVSCQHPWSYKACISHTSSNVYRSQLLMAYFHTQFLMDIAVACIPAWKNIVWECIVCRCIPDHHPAFYVSTELKHLSLYFFMHIACFTWYMAYLPA